MPALQSRKLDDSALPRPPPIVVVGAPAHPPMPSFVERWRIYASQPVLLSSLSLVLLYITALQPGFLLTSYLKSQRVDDIALASFQRRFAAVSGLLSTVVVPLLLSRGVRVETLALASVSLQFLCLLPTLFDRVCARRAARRLHGVRGGCRASHSTRSTCASLKSCSRACSEPVRGVVNAAEGSLTNLASACSATRSASFRPTREPTLATWLSCRCSRSRPRSVCSAIHWRNARDRAQLLRLSKV
jgi:hypothetical protein